MIKFSDGPAMGQTLHLQRVPIFLRVVEKDGKWDALDQKDDEPRPGEKLYAYTLAEEPSRGFIDGTKYRGPFNHATYVYIAPSQPTQEQMATLPAWVAWCETNRHLTRL